MHLHLGRSLKRFFAKFHMTLFVVFIVGGLSSAVLLVNDIITDPTIGNDYQSPITAGSIDQETLNRINQLHRSNEQLTPATQSSERINPFTE